MPTGRAADPLLLYSCDDDRRLSCNYGLTGVKAKVFDFASHCTCFGHDWGGGGPATFGGASGARRSLTLRFSRIEIEIMECLRGLLRAPEQGHLIDCHGPAVLNGAG